MLFTSNLRVLLLPTSDSVEVKCLCVSCPPSVSAEHRSLCERLFAHIFRGGHKRRNCQLQPQRCLALLTDAGRLLLLDPSGRTLRVREEVLLVPVTRPRDTRKRIYIYIYKVVVSVLLLQKTVHLAADGEIFTEGRDMLIYSSAEHGCYLLLASEGDTASFWARSLAVSIEVRLAAVFA